MPKRKADAPRRKGTRRQPEEETDQAESEDDEQLEVDAGEQDEGGGESEGAGSSESDEDDLDLVEAQGQPTELQVEFIFTDPSEDDAPYIRALLHNGTLVKASNSDAAGLAKLVADQVAIGTLIKADGELFGFLSAISLQRHARNPSVMPLLSLLSERVSCPEVTVKLKSLLLSGSAPVGLVLSERMVNTPISLVPHAVESLSLDIDWAKKHEEDEAERLSFNFGHLLILAQVQLGSGALDAGEAAGTSVEQGGGAADRAGLGRGMTKGRKKAKVACKSDVLARVTFSRVEEEILAEEAEAVSLINGALPGGDRLMVMILKPDALASAVPAIKAVMCD